MTKNEKNQMKSVIKPLIKECLHEIMLEEGLIRMMKEHVSQPVVQKKVETPKYYEKSRPLINSLREQSMEKKNQAMNEVKKVLSSGGFDPFAGTKDLETREAEEESKKGVQLENLFNQDMINSWNQQLEILGDKKE